MSSSILPHAISLNEQPRIGELLVSRGLISAGDLAAALAAKHADERLGETLVRLGIVFESDLARPLAAQCGVGYIELTASTSRAGASGRSSSRRCAPGPPRTGRPQRSTAETR